MYGTGELRELKKDTAKLEAYFSTKDTAGSVAGWPVGPLAAAATAANVPDNARSSAPATAVATSETRTTAVLGLDHLPTKLSALSHMLEEAGATDDDVAEVRVASSRVQRSDTIVRPCHVLVTSDGSWCSDPDVRLRQPT